MSGYRKRPSGAAAVWDSVFGKTLRWMLFLPVGLLMLFISEILLTVAAAWVFSMSLSTLVILLVLFGSVSFLIPLFLLVAGFTAHLAARIAPNAQVGVTVLGFVFVFIQVFSVIGDLMRGVHWIQPVVKVAVTLVALYAFVLTYREADAEADAGENATPQQRAPNVLPASPPRRSYATTYATGRSSQLSPSIYAAIITGLVIVAAALAFRFLP